MSTVAIPEARHRQLQFSVRITHDPILGARVVLRLEPTVFIEPIHTLHELGAYFTRMADWEQWQLSDPTTTDATSVWTNPLEELIR
jgi:hypothetical protein